jgi:hypothetical protein
MPPVAPLAVSVEVAPMKKEAVPLMVPELADGLTVIIKGCTEPTQPLAIGVTENTPLVAVAPVFVAVNGAIDDPLPLAAIPIAVLSLFHV